MGLEYDDRDENFDWVERKSEEWKNKIQLTTKQLEDSDSLILQLSEEDSVQTNSRCVSVDTFSITPDGRNKKKKLFRGKTELIKFRCTSLEKKLLMNRAKRCGLTLSEYFRRVAFDRELIFCSKRLFLIFSLQSQKYYLSMRKLIVFIS